MPGTQPIDPVYRPSRVRLVRLVCRVLARAYLRIRVEGGERFPSGAAICVFNHLCWVDPLILLAVLPERPRVAMFGPKEEDMSRGARNRLIRWAGFGIPYRPAKTDMLETTRRVQRVIDRDWIVVIAGEGRIHSGERELLPLADGTAYFALRSKVPIVPIALNGTSWLGFRRTIRVRVGEAIVSHERPTRSAVDALTARTSDALRSMVADYPDVPAPGPFGRWLTELFNDWPGGVRPEPRSASNPGRGPGPAA